MSRAGAMLAVGFLLLLAGAGLLGYTIGSNAAPDEADAASARAEAQSKALAAARGQAYDKAFAEGKAKGEAAGAAGGRADGGSDGFAAANQELAATREKPKKGDCLASPGGGCLSPPAPVAPSGPGKSGK